MNNDAPGARGARDGAPVCSLPAGCRKSFEGSGGSPAPLPGRGYLYVVFAALLWAVSGSSAKFLFSQGVNPFQLIQLRVTLSSALLFLWLFGTQRGMLHISRGDVLYFAGLGGVVMALVQFTYLYSISLINVAAAILLEYLSPVFIALYSIAVEREMPGRGVLLAMAGTVSGCYLVVGGYHLDPTAMNPKGIVVGIFSGISFAAYSVCGEYGMRRYHPWTVLFYALLFSAVTWNVAYPPFDFATRRYTAEEVGWMLYIVIFGTIIPFGLFLGGISLLRSARACVTATLEPIAAAAVSYVFLGEALEPLQIAGGALVIASIATLQLRRDYDDRTPDRIRGRGTRGINAERHGDEGHGE